MAGLLQTETLPSAEADGSASALSTGTSASGSASAGLSGLGLDLLFALAFFFGSGVDFAFAAVTFGFALAAVTFGCAFALVAAFGFAVGSTGFAATATPAVSSPDSASTFCRAIAPGKTMASGCKKNCRTALFVDSGCL